MRQLNSRGFTIVELLVATSVFASILIICSVGLIQITKMYYRGIIGGRVQGISRLVAEDIQDTIRFTGTEPTAEAEVSGKHYFCIGRIRYTFYENTTRESGTHVLWRDVLSSDVCTGPAPIENPDPGGTDGKELMGDNMRLSYLEVSPQGADLYGVSVVVAHADVDQIEGTAADTKCIVGLAGSEFCAVSRLFTTAQKRLN